MKKILSLLLLFIGSCVFAQDAKTMVDSANQAYAHNEFSKAVMQYEKVISSGYEGAEIYFNLGNAYFKSNQNAKAILNYERAKKLKPNDEDINTNLKIAYQKTTDKIEPLPQLFLTEWKNGFLESYSERGWSWLCIIFFSLSLAFFALYFISTRIGLRQAGFWGGSLLTIITIVLFFIASHQNHSALNRNEAIITTATVTANGSPDEKGTKLFLLHEGTKVIITDNSGDWTEVKLSNGSVGWIKKTDFEVI